LKIAYHGGVTWSNTSSFPISDGSVFRLDGDVIMANVTSESPWARQKSSKECDNRDIIISSTPWTFNVTKYVDESFRSNDSYTKSPDFRMRALLCDSIISSTEKPTTINMPPGSSTSLRKAKRDDTRIGQFPSFLNFTAFQYNNLEKDDWIRFLDQNSFLDSSKLDDLIGGSESDESEWYTRKPHPRRPDFYGMGALLGSLSNWNLTTIIEDPLLTQKVARIKGRFFLELLRNSLSDPQLIQEQTVPGKATAVETRVLVLREIAITLAVLFGVSSCLLGVVLWSTCTSRRPLNLQTDPGSTVGMSLLLDSRLNSINTFKTLHNAPKNIPNAKRFRSSAISSVMF
jgi:hypothetical protein